jgi:hypothetical protein
VELEATLATRLERNQTPLRIAHKPSKADVEASEARLLSNEHGHRMNSSGDFFYAGHYLKIDNEHLGPEQVAALIQEAFKL